MPELPEVQTIVNDLTKHVLGYTIKNVKVLKTVGLFPDATTFASELKNQEIIGVERIAKNIVISLKSEKALVVHLAMTGRVLLQEPKQKIPQWTRVILEIQKDAVVKTLNLADMRMFGKIILLDKGGIERLKAKYGPEPLDDITPELFLKKIQSKRTTIKNALLDQEITAGLGNIYATDSLFLARIHPETPTAAITINAAEKLLNTARIVLREGIKHRGSTLGDKMFVDIFGKEGTHQNHFKIYGKVKCPDCGTKVIIKKINGRGTYFCPSCQILGAQTPLL